MESFQQPCVWVLVQELVPDSEVPEVRSVLGNALLDMHTEIHAEVQMWEQIWREAQCSGHGGHGGQMPSPQSSLPDPPAIKALLRAEIQLLLLTLREQAARLGRDEGEVMCQYSPRVVRYALSDGVQGKTPDVSVPHCTPVSSLSNCGSRSSSRLSSRSRCVDVIEALKQNLNITHIDEVVTHLRSVLTEECEALRRDVELLQEKMELVYKKRAGPELVDPTITELKEERRVLLTDLNTLRVAEEVACSDTPGSCARSDPTRGLTLTPVPAADPHTNTSSPLVFLWTDRPYRKPSPPGAPRSIQLGLAGRPTHRPASKALALDQPKGLDFDHSSLTHWMCPTLPPSTSGSSTHSFLLSEEGCAVKPQSSRTHPAVGPVLRQPHGSTPAGAEFRSVQPLLRPTPPAAQRMASRGQQANRRMGFRKAGSLLSSS
ncbi:coiled-coil domain-containing protein 24 [Brachyhypopomus gauderio]|uniref:coiled-coil domain-containing protein 24 n=1 Tax=Brachyhypopomus gauderio TaxID=698409 RepID=UPI0040434421